ncbi:MAG: MerR family transcriptional regulator [Defluviitaleaceae bacterium]|nr:MerR family transcriptional regulator [Defluviitaleaceae bacterium]
MKISQISKLTDTPASTIRDYESFNFIEPAERLHNSYRVFNERHIVQIKLCRLAFREFINKPLRKASLQVLYAAAKNDMPLCHINIENYIVLLETEIQKADDVFKVIKKWTSSDVCKEEELDYTLKMAAECIGTTKETIRNWERNGLLGNNLTAYKKRIYKTCDIERMKVIYMLIQTGYSIMAINKYFLTLAQSNDKALQILIDPNNDEDLFSIQDRWFQTLISAKSDGMKMLAIIGKAAQPPFADELQW